jgi:lysylphosphatidylglycerol synthetase-like protein (DUF2156 family)
MKKSAIYEATAATLMVVGAILLVFVFYPHINPVQYRFDSGQESAPINHYIVGVPVSLLFLAGAIYFNRKARKIRRGKEHEQPPLA